VPTSGNRVIRLAALVRAPGKIEVVLRSDETGFQADHFRALCRFDTAREVATESDSVPNFAFNGDAGQLLAIDPLQDLYGRILFHRGRFQRVEGYRELSATRCLAEVSPDGQARWFGGYLPETMLLGDPAMRDAAIHAIQACIPHGTILPVGIDRVILSERLTGPCFVRAEEREHIGDRFVYDLAILSADGSLYERWEGLRLQRVDTAAPAARWAGPLLAPYLERRLAELVPGASATVAVTNNSGLGDSNGENGHESNGSSLNWHTQRQMASDRAMAAAVGEPLTIHRRPDGKPVALCDRAVSVSHASGLAVSIASKRRLVACDAEPVVQRDLTEWKNLLTADRGALARLIAEQASAGDFHAAATRIWSAGECLKKAGLPLDTPLMHRETTPDHWVVLSAGAATIATWVGTLRDSTAPLAVALLVGNEGVGSHF
jgi:enediyne polyketide synthase